MIEMTLSSRHRIRNSSPGGLRPSTEAPHNTNFHTWMGKKQFCFFQTAETGNRTPDSGVKGSGASHYPRAPARNAVKHTICVIFPIWIQLSADNGHVQQTRYILPMLLYCSCQRRRPRHNINSSTAQRVVFLGSNV